MVSLEVQVHLPERVFLCTTDETTVCFDFVVGIGILGTAVQEVRASLSGTVPGLPHGIPPALVEPLSHRQLIFHTAKLLAFGLVQETLHSYFDHIRAIGTEIGVDDSNSLVPTTDGHTVWVDSLAGFFNNAVQSGEGQEAAGVPICAEVLHISHLLPRKV